MNNSNKQMVWVNQIIQINNKWTKQTKQTKQIYNVQRKYIFLIFSNLFWSRVLDDLSLNRKDHLVPNFIFDSKIIQLQTTKAFFLLIKLKKWKTKHPRKQKIVCTNILPKRNPNFSLSPRYSLIQNFFLKFLLLQYIRASGCKRIKIWLEKGM